MTCRWQEPDYAPEGGYTWDADALTEAILCPARRPLAHGNPDGLPPGAMSFVTAHRVRVKPIGPPVSFDPLPPDDPSTHYCYGQLTRRADGRCQVRMASQPSGMASSRAWHIGRVFRQMEPDLDPDGPMMPLGACGVRVEFMSPYPVQVNYHADTVLCKGRLE